MHKAITMEGDNPVSKVSKKVLEMLTTGKKNWVDIYCETLRLGNKDQINEALDFLVETGQASLKIETDPDTEKSVTYWSLK